MKFMYKKLVLRANTNLYQKILGFLIKKGKKQISLNLLILSFSKICKIIKRPAYYILTKLFILLNVFVETRTVRTRRRTSIVPFPLILKRRLYLITKWLFLTIRKNHEKVSFFEKFVKEVVNIFSNKKKSEIFNLQSSNNSKALLNRSNIHYRW